MAVITARTGARAWATATDWVGDACPIDNVDSFVIPADCQMQMNQDQSAWTGLLGGVIETHATTPGMIYQKDGGGTGHLKIKTGYHITGSGANTELGRIHASASGVWGDTTPLAFADKFVIDLRALPSCGWNTCSSRPTTTSQPRNISRSMARNTNSLAVLARWI